MAKGGKPKPKATAKATPRRHKTTAQSTAVAKIPQPHGGALNAGGTPGNNGGRPPSVVRQRARGGFYDRIPTLEKIADSGRTGDADRIRAISVLGTIGMGSSMTADDVRERLRLTLAAIRRELSSEDAERVLIAIRPYWIGGE
ncbi:MAG: hypothetical protein ABI665_28450 [Vicinamibacterales bacterium]